jgi:hypothetical protein
MTKFLSKDPEKALAEVKEVLYDRLKVLRQCVGPDDEYGDDVINQMRNEIDFLEDLLDTIERS